MSAKPEYLPIEPDEIKNCTAPVSNNYDAKLNPNIIVLKNGLGEMQKGTLSTLRYSFSQSVRTEKLRRALLETFAVYMPWRNDLKQNN